PVAVAAAGASQRRPSLSWGTPRPPMPFAAPDAAALPVLLPSARLLPLVVQLRCVPLLPAEPVSVAAGGGHAIPWGSRANRSYRCGAGGVNGKLGRGSGRPSR